MASLSEELGEYLREQRQNAKLTLRQLAEAADVSNPYLSQIERGLKKPSAEILQSLAKGLRISAESLYVRAGILDERDEYQASVETAILADPVLSERQRRVLLDIYESFRTENARKAESASPGTAADVDPAPDPSAHAVPAVGAAAEPSPDPSVRARKRSTTRTTPDATPRSTP